MGLALTNWELNTIHKMSKAYVVAFNASNEKNVPAPYQSETFDREAINKKAASIFRSLALKNKRKNGFKGPQL